ncbi:DNA-binding protein, putative [Candida dubliniensis CD36]|uniref:DNA-binding protein, putative n=1 Tax=Candida dubliniensis (strain CD36 / ATCC MYA-646 / CBS 7987 / NCPF 3949 / NRRL Y-17841) TaxID=573826 RepID=B9WJZ8_CANDC|nr:DNA-binding protein, putative [Candida dubliniensis CD36]CAX40874.1 DNA-binding protein, putative [Candida dubliniensis CD36]
MSKSNINKKLKLLEKSIYDDLINKIKGLDLDNAIIEKIEGTISKPKRKAPVTPIEKQCGKLTKKGEKCKIAMCYKRTCWAHLTKEQKEEYRKLKKIRCGVAHMKSF